MTYDLIIKSPAETDIAKAVEWYADKSKKLGRRFLNVVNGSLTNIKDQPTLFQRRYREIRIVFIQYFPYGIYYTIEHKTIYEHEVLHTKRNPETVIERI